jgi:hypothetical protein
MSKQMMIEVMRVTPAMAEKWLKKNHPENRRISPDRVTSLANDMLAGGWKLTHQGICFDAGGFVIDGQHRLSAIVQSRTAVDMVVATNHEGQLSDPIDRHRLRSLSFLTSLNTRQLAAAKVLIGLSQGFENNVPLTTSGALETFELYRPGYEKLKAAKPDKFLGGVLAALIYAVPVDEEKVVDFAMKVSTGEMIKKGDPAFALRSWITSNTSRQRGWEAAMATMSCARYHIVGQELRSVFTGDMAYRAFSTRRRALKVPHTPGNDLVPSVKWAPSRNE